MYKKLKTILDTNSFYVLVILIISLFIFKPLFSDGYPSWMDNSTPPVLNMERFDNISNFTYAEHFHGLVYNSNAILMNFLPNKMAVVLHKFFTDPRILSMSWLVLPYLAMYTCLYFSFLNIFHKKNLGFLLTLFFIFSPLNLSMIAYGWDLTTYSIAFGFLFLSYLIKYLEHPLFKYIITMSLLSLLGTINSANFYAFLIGALVYFLAYVLVNKLNLKTTYKRYKSLLVLPILSILINLYWILPTIPMSREVNQKINLPNIYPTSILTSINTFSFNTSFALFDDYHEVFKFFTSSFFSTFYYLLIFTVIFYVVKNTNNKLLKIFLLLYLLFFGLSLGENFGLLWEPFQRLPGAFIIRSPQLKFFPILFFFLSVLIGLVIKEYKSKIIVCIVILIISLGIFGFYKGNLFSFWKNVFPPKDYDEIVMKLNSIENRDETVAEFPRIWGQPKIKWLNDRYAYPIINSMIYNPMIIYNNWNDSVVPIYIKSVYINPFVNIAKVLGNGGVKYVLVHKDYSDFSVKQGFSFTKGLTLILVGENIELYEVSDNYYKSLFYSDKENLEYERVSPVMYLVNAKPGDQITFNRQHDISLRLYDKTDIKESGYYKCNFSISNLNFCDILLLKVKPLPRQPLGKDYKNNWILPENSSGSYVVYYEPQIYFYIGLIISFIAFMWHVLYLLLVRESDKNKQIVLD